MEVPPCDFGAAETEELFGGGDYVHYCEGLYGEFRGERAGDGEAVGDAGAAVVGD